MLGHGLARIPETRGLARVINARAAGIKDLRYGACVEEDWRDYDPNEFLRDRCTEVPFLPGAHYYFIAASLREGPVGELLGDLLVRLPSSSGAAGAAAGGFPFRSTTATSWREPIIPTCSTIRPSTGSSGPGSPLMPPASQASIPSSSIDLVMFRP